MTTTSAAHYVVDGSNIATEGRSRPSLEQLQEAVTTFMADHPDSMITVVVDATFGHRIDPSEKNEFDEAIANNELVAPPAGAIGRGDAFVLTIADRAGASVLEQAPRCCQTTPFRNFTVITNGSSMRVDSLVGNQSRMSAGYLWLELLCGVRFLERQRRSHLPRRLRSPQGERQVSRRVSQCRFRQLRLQVPLHGRTTLRRRQRPRVQHQKVEIRSTN